MAHSIRHRLTTVPALAGLLLAPLAAAAQGTADQARLMFSIGVGQASGGGELWSVGKQPFIAGVGQVDTLSVQRDFRKSLAVAMSGTYFPGQHLGINVEATLLGLATRDACAIRYTSGASLTQELCSSISRQERNATSAALSAGAFYRLWSTQTIHPYVRANAGLVVTQQSFLRTVGRVHEDTVTNESSELRLFEDGSTSSVQPYFSFGGGIVTVIGRGYQLRFEVRDNFVRIPAVTGPTDRQGLVPPHGTVGKHLLTFTVNFDVVLERKRGRRY